MTLHVPRDVVGAPLVLAQGAADAFGARAVALRVVRVLRPEVAGEGALVEVALGAGRERAAEGLAVLARVLSEVGC